MLSVLGEFVMPAGGSVWTGTALEALALLSVEEPAGRQALARTSARGLLTPQRIRRRTRWDLTERSWKALTEGAARIYGHALVEADWDGRWLLVLTTVPEHNRHLRARLRARMTWAGLASVGAGVWVTPWTDREPDVEAILAELDLAAGSLSWVGRPGTLGEVEERVEEIWDLTGIEADYKAFMAAAAEEDPASPEEAFAALIRLVHDWRHFPATDPGLPSALLPPGWLAQDAAAVFQARRAEWSPAAWTYWQAADRRHAG